MQAESVIENIHSYESGRLKEIEEKQSLSHAFSKIYF